MVVAAEPTSEPPLFAYSRKRSLRVAPATSARAHRLPVYVPAEVGEIQSGESFSVASLVAAGLLATLAAKDPL